MKFGHTSVNIPLGTYNKSKVIKAEVVPVDNNERLQEVVLIDINITKTWTAYITRFIEDSKMVDESVISAEYVESPPRYFLTISEFKDARSRQVKRYSFEVTGYFEADVNGTCAFFSISPDGKRVAMSFMHLDAYSQAIDKPTFNPDCLIFKIREDGNELWLDRKIRFQGRAVFSKNNDLMLINKQILEVYSPTYNKKKWFDLRPIIHTSILKMTLKICMIDYMKNQPWVWYTDRHLNSGYSDVMDVISMSRHIRHNVLLTVYEHKTHVWSITENGTLLTSIFKQKEEEIMAFTNNYKYFVTFKEPSRDLIIYNIKSGLMAYQLHPKREIPTGKVYEITYCRFCKDAKYLIVTGLESSPGDPTDTLLTFEVWHIESEQSIHFEKRKFYASAIHREILQPFVHSDDFEMLLKRSKRHRISSSDQLLSQDQVYSQRVIGTDKGGQVDVVQEDLDYTIRCYYVEYQASNNTTIIEEVKIDLNETERMENCKIQEIYDKNTWNNSLAVRNNKENGLKLDSDPVDQERFGWKRVQTNVSSSEDFTDGIHHPTDFNRYVCFVRYYEGQVYVLKFGKHLVEFWRLSEISKERRILSGSEPTEDEILIEDSDELLFIHGYKTVTLGFTHTFRESWSPVYENESSIKIIHSGDYRDINRILLSIRVDEEYQTQEMYYYEDEGSEELDEGEKDKGNEEDESWKNSTEEIFLPFHQIVKQQKLSNNNLHLCLKSACQALHYICNMPKKERNKNYQKVFNKTLQIVYKYIEEIGNKRHHEYKYFSTISGSNMMATLASFREGRKVLLEILKCENIPISLFSYARKLSAEKFEENLSTNENALIVLIQELSYNLYNILFNRILADSKEIGIGCLTVVTDALIYLQEISNTDILLSSTQKLSYLKIEINKSASLSEEESKILKLNLGKSDYTTNLRMLEPYSSKEQMTPYTNHIFDLIRYTWITYTKYDDRYQFYNLNSSFYHSILARLTFKPLMTVLLQVKRIFSGLHKEYRKSHKTPGKVAALCVVPLPHFLSYSDFPEDRVSEPHEPTNIEGVIPYKNQSAFLRIATNQSDDSIFRQGNTVMEVLMRYKWNTYIWYHFFIMYFVCLTFYISFFVGICFSQEVFGYELGTAIVAPGQEACIALMFTSLAVLIIQELRQLSKTYNKFNYLLSLYNWIDMITFALPVTTLAVMLHRPEAFDNVNCVAVLFIWLHGILKLRPFSVVGLTLETSIQLIRSVKGILLIMFLVICAFTNAYMVLLAREPDESFQEQFEGSLEGTEGGNISLADVSSQNGFDNVFLSFSNLWFFLYGVWDPISGDVGDNPMVTVVSILFSFIIVLIFFNIVIAYMNSSIEEVKQRGKKAWISHFSSVIAEMEQLWCLPYTKKIRKFNPTYIYYIAHVAKINQKKEILENETSELIEKLTIEYATESYKGISSSKEDKLEDLKRSLRLSLKLLSEHPDILDIIKDEL